ncbi:peptidyl-prolyl cis-trans isomerase [Nocardioides daejeonensis]|uniref:peptidyl-prolyl cis-trans isomerase n=1 Tax=Nocardioides daejeonensis TaxID=1046556 RepID=UPI000D750D2D|nr:peptidyl-prolyl cis-trans isomerase [Nocardioides daejeonensis]
MSLKSAYRSSVMALRDDPWVPTGALRWVALATALVLAVGSGVALAQVRSDDELADGVALRIGDRDVTIEMLDQQTATLEALYGVVPPVDEEAANGFRRDTAKSYVLGEVIGQEVRRRGIVIAEKKARAELNKIVEERLAGDREAFARYLGDAGITEEAVLAEISRTLATNALFEVVVADVPDATIEQAQEEYDENRARMTTPERRSISNIVVASEDDAKAVLAELEDGGDFATVAATSSLDSSTSKKGGALGTVEATGLDAAYADVAFSARKGEFFGPVRSEYGWNVGVVTAVQPGKPLSFAEVKATLVAALTSRAQGEKWARFLGDLLERAEITYADAYRPADPDALPTGSIDPATGE